MPNTPPIFSGQPRGGEDEEGDSAKRQRLNLGETLAREDTGIEVQFQRATFEGVQVQRGTANALLTKAQADRLYAGGGGEAAISSDLDGLEQTIIGTPPPDTILLRHVATGEITIDSLVMDVAQASSSSGFSLIVERINGNTRSVAESETVSLVIGDNRASGSIGITVSPPDLLTVSTGQPGGGYTDEIRDLTFNLAVS